MHVIETIDRLSELALSKHFRRKAEACFLLVSRILPFYRRYAHTGGARHTPFDIRDHILFPWSQYCVGSTVSVQDALQLEAHIPDVDNVGTSDSQLAVYAQSAVICALHLTWYLARRDDTYVKGCVVNYFDHIDELARERIGVDSGVPDLTDILVARSRLFQRETACFEAALLKDERKDIVSRPLLIANMDREIRDEL
jgi:hypothetical protein